MKIIGDVIGCNNCDMCILQSRQDFKIYVPTQVQTMTTSVGSEKIHIAIASFQNPPHGSDKAAIKPTNHGNDRRYYIEGCNPDMVEA